MFNINLFYSSFIITNYTTGRGCLNGRNSTNKRTNRVTSNDGKGGTVANNKNRSTKHNCVYYTGITLSSMESGKNLHIDNGSIPGATLSRYGKDSYNGHGPNIAECIKNNFEFIISPASGCICKQTTHIL